MRVEIPDEYFDQFEDAKYRSRNPVKRALMRRFARIFLGLLDRAQPETSIIEIGCGEGFLSGLMHRSYPQLALTALDLDSRKLEKLASHFPSVRVLEGSVYELDSLDKKCSASVCAEVLEHLDEPERALAEIASLEPHHSIFTVPHEPWFMLTNLAAGKNLTRFGNDPEHINHFSPRSFRGLLETHFEVLEITTSYPWILALTRPRA